MKINALPASNSKWVMDNKKSNHSKENYQVETGKAYLEFSKLLLSSNVPSAADPKTNSINIKPGEIRNIGSVDGFPLNIIFESYGMNSSFGVMVNAYEPVNSPRNQLAWELFNKYTPAQREKAGLISSRFNLLYQVANGSMSVNDYNSYQQIPGAISTSQLLTSLGIDVAKPFSFNGNMYSLDSEGKLHAFLPANEYGTSKP